MALWCPDAGKHLPPGHRHECKRHKEEEVSVFNNILVVCTGNICRSPVGEALLKQALPGKTVHSAGVGALVDHPLLKSAFGLQDTDQVVGFIYIGTAARELPERSRLSVDDFLSDWHAQ